MPLETGGPGDGSAGAGVRFYRGPLPLRAPHGLDAWLAWKRKWERAKVFRALWVVNGWQFGRSYPVIEPEDTFPVPAGVLDLGRRQRGRLGGLGARVDVEFVGWYAVASSFDVGFDGGYLWPVWNATTREHV
ncbi:uncharacterized protein THITE_2084619 [Thermothielavioides terrestris NRRL 8126]|uniref:Beta-galactosidase jelly roll domain-containing protein n=1 Tax=Thermothielavioides terrestris (strain ATCC 38088 / NRRL 8126) TaxID=578455 RepID=G2QWU4_THETT|nr:uncharacterized protein THITE_2084619 [Thermothielavioides terrestris NRRL 8126]AEO63108.1 hypothetical protein THITE_2084619 [Thermothielavioides terrestris NRRL 8126]